MVASSLPHIGDQPGRREAAELPGATYALLFVDGEPLRKSIPSRAILRGSAIYQNKPLAAALADIGGLCRRLARSTVGPGLMSRVEDECILQPADDPVVPDDRDYGIEEAE